MDHRLLGANFTHRVLADSHENGGFRHGHFLHGIHLPDDDESELGLLPTVVSPGAI